MRVVRLVSAIIRHGKTGRSWDTLGYEELLSLIKLKSDPDADIEFLKNNLDEHIVASAGISRVIYSSPIKRALQTAKYIAELAGAEVIADKTLAEIKFDSLPYDVYEKGSNAVRLKLLEYTRNASVEINRKLFSGNNLVVSHGFIMRRFYAALFNEDFGKLSLDARFTSYLSGFDYMQGGAFSLLKKA